jgi:hypothetical protein
MTFCAAKTGVAERANAVPHKNFLISNFIKAPQEWGRACLVKFNEF